MKKLDKTQAMHLQPAPPELLAFAPLDGTTTRYCQLYCTIHDDAHKTAGIRGFLPHNPFNGIREQATTLLYGTSDLPFPRFRSLAELNIEIILMWYSGDHTDLDAWLS